MARRTLKHFKKYTQRNCLLTYLNDVVVKSCKVNLPGFRSDDRLSMLDNYCVTEATQRFKNSSENLKAHEQCPEECCFIDYSFDSSHAAYPSVFYKRIMKDYFAFWKSVDPSLADSASKIDLGENVLSVNIFYKELALNSVDEKPALTALEFISSAGNFISFLKILAFTC